MSLKVQIETRLIWYMNYYLSRILGVKFAISDYHLRYPMVYPIPRFLRNDFAARAQIAVDDSCRNCISSYERLPRERERERERERDGPRPQNRTGSRPVPIPQLISTMLPNRNRPHARETVNLTESVIETRMPKRDGTIRRFEGDMFARSTDASMQRFAVWIAVSVARSLC